MSKIITLQAENIKKLKAVEIRPYDNMVLLTGKNGQGKSSILDCISYALLGKSSIPEKPIRDGEQTGTIKLDLGELIVTRKFIRKKSGEITTSVLVTNKEGAKYSSPQMMLEKLLSAITFDPLAFSRMKSKEQFDELRKIMEIDYDFEKSEQLNKQDYDSRTGVNRRVKQLEIEIESISYLKDTPDEAVDTGGLLITLTARETMRSLRADLEKEIVNTYDNISELRKQIEAAEDDLIEKTGTLESLTLVTDKEIDDLKNTITLSSEINNDVANKIKKQKLEADFDDLYRKSIDYTNSINHRGVERGRALAAAKMPVSGLSLGEGEVLFNDLPLDQASDAERLRLSCSIAMSGNPELKVLRIKEGSLLDNDGLKLLHEMAKEKDYQIWVEKVDDSGTIGIVIEDGEIKTINDNEENK